MTNKKNDLNKQKQESIKNPIIYHDFNKNDIIDFFLHGLKENDYAVNNYDIEVE